MDNVQAGDGKTQIPVSLHTLQISGGQAFILQQVLSRARHKNGNNLPAKSPQPVITLHFAMPEFTQATSASAINVTLAQAGAKQILDNTSSTRSGVLCEEAHADGDNININSGNVSLVTIGQHEAGNYSFPPTLWSPWHPLDISTFTMIGAPASRPLNSLMSLSSLAPTIITGQKQLTGLPETLYPGVESRELEERGHSIDLNQHLGLILNQMEMYSTSLTANRNRSNCANSILLKNNLYADDSRVNVSSMDDKMTIANAEEDTNINTLVDELLWRYSELPIDELIKELPSDDYSVNTLTEDKGHSALHFINNIQSVQQSSLSSIESEHILYISKSYPENEYNKGDIHFQEKHNGKNYKRNEKGNFSKTCYNKFKCETETCMTAQKEGSKCPLKGAGYCIVHGDDSTHPKCKKKDCTKCLLPGEFFKPHRSNYRKCKSEDRVKHSKLTRYCYSQAKLLPQQKCQSEGCSKRPISGGYCKAHGGKHRKCKAEDCCKYPVIKGYCISHAKSFAYLRCTTEGSVLSLPNGNCEVRGKTYRKCKVEGCSMHFQIKGYCHSHANLLAQWKCQTEGCSKRPLPGGFCKAHGGKHRKCKAEDCSKYPSKKGYCNTHATLLVHWKCQSKGCSKIPLPGGYCKAHGGVYKKCKAEGCCKYAQVKGYCKSHAKSFTDLVCLTEGCSEYPLLNGYCKAHGGIYRECKAEKCCKYAQIKGYCRSHAKLFVQWKCVREGCFKYPLKNGYCRVHE